MSNTFVFDDNETLPGTGASAPEMSGPDEPQPEGGEGNNRTFLIAAIILGGIVLLSLICMAVYALLILPGQKANIQKTSEANQAAVVMATNVSMETQAAALFTATLPPSETPQPVPTETAVVVFATNTALLPPTTEPATATFEAMQTQVAVNMLTAAATSGTSGVAGAAGAAGSGTQGAVGAAGTAGAQGTPGAVSTQELAKTGFADEVGLPGLFIITIILVAVILLARRLRQSPMAH